MRTMRVHLIRHAEYAAIDRVLTGRQSGHVLNAAGRAQAERLAALDAPIAAVVSSPLERAVETATPLAQSRGLAVETEAGFLEIDYGAWTGTTVAELDGDPAWRLWNLQRGIAGTPGGETMAGVQSRAVAALNRLRERFADAEIAIVSHADVIRAVVCATLGLSLDLMLRFEIAPASRTTIRFEPWGATLVQLNRSVPSGPDQSPASA